MRAIFAVLLLLPCAARAQPWQDKFPLAVIDRPLVLPDNVIELDLLGNSSTQSGASAGETVAVGVELGLGEGQAGIAVALPAIPGFGFGSVVGSASYLLEKHSALRVDLAFEHSQGDIGRPNQNFYALGAGLPARLRLTPWLMLVSGSVGAIGFAHFTNLSAGGAGFYRGASTPLAAADIFVFTKQEDGISQVSLQLPLGLLFQPVKSLAVIARTGYQIIFVTDGDGPTRHFVPLGLDAELSLGHSFDVGASFSLPGEMAETGGGGRTTFGYADIRLATVWLRLRN